MKFLILATLVALVAAEGAWYSASNSTEEQQCGENEWWAECATCEPSCLNGATWCPLECKPSKCMCKREFLRDPLGKCVHRNECPAVDPLKPE